MKRLYIGYNACENSYIRTFCFSLNLYDGLCIWEEAFPESNQLYECGGYEGRERERLRECVCGREKRRGGREKKRRKGKEKMSDKV